MQIYVNLTYLIQHWEDVPSVTINPPQPSPSDVSLVIHGDVAEQVGHGLSVVDAADGLGQYHADIHRFYFGTLQLLYFMGHGVGHHHLRVH